MSNPNYALSSHQADPKAFAPVRPAGILCGNCKGYHVNVAAVRGCYQGQDQFTIEVNGQTTRPNAPEPKYASSPLASAKQLSFLRTLCQERDTTVEFEAPVSLEALTMGQASQLIKDLLARPKAKANVPTVQQTMKASTLPDVAAGRYALELDGITKFFKVDRPTEGTWAGRTFVKLQVSDAEYPVRDKALARQVLELVAKDPKAAMLRYGRELGHCGHCGRTLTNEDSRAAGIGPICSGKMGW